MKKQTMGERVELLRRAYSLNKAEFAKKTGCTPLTIGNIERGITQTLQPEALNGIVSAFGTSREWLDSGAGKMLPHGKVDLGKVPESWKDEAWTLAKDQLEKKDATIDRLSISFDRLTEFLNKVEINFLHPVKESA